MVILVVMLLPLLLLVLFMVMVMGEDGHSRDGWHHSSRYWKDWHGLRSNKQVMNNAASYLRFKWSN